MKILNTSESRIGNVIRNHVEEDDELGFVNGQGEFLDGRVMYVDTRDEAPLDEDGDTTVVRLETNGRPYFLYVAVGDWSEPERMPSEDWSVWAADREKFENEPWGETYDSGIGYKVDRLYYWEAESDMPPRYLSEIEQQSSEELVDNPREHVQSVIEQLHEEVEAIEQVIEITQRVADDELTLEEQERELLRIEAESGGSLPCSFDV